MTVLRRGDTCGFPGVLLSVARPRGDTGSVSVVLRRGDTCSFPATLLSVVRPRGDICGIPTVRPRGDIGGILVVRPRGDTCGIPADLLSVSACGVSTALLGGDTCGIPTDLPNIDSCGVSFALLRGDTCGLPADLPSIDSYGVSFALLRGDTCGTPADLRILRTLFVPTSDSPPPARFEHSGLSQIPWRGGTVRTWVFAFFAPPRIMHVYIAQVVGGAPLRQPTIRWCSSAVDVITLTEWGGGYCDRSSKEPDADGNVSKSLSLLSKRSWEPVVRDIAVQKQKQKSESWNRQKIKNTRNPKAKVQEGLGRNCSQKQRLSHNISQIAGWQRTGTGKWINNLTAKQIYRLRCVRIYTGMSNKLEESWEVMVD